MRTADPRTPKVFTIPVYRAFGDALVKGLLAQHRGDRLSLARGVILVPNNRAARAINDAFVRRAGGGLLIPRIVPIGDAGEQPGALFETDLPVPPAVAPLDRMMILGRLVQQERALARAQIGAAEALRLAAELAAVLDELIAEDVSPQALRTLEVTPELAVHWQASLDLFATIIDRWPEELTRLGRVDLPERRNRLLRGLADQWHASPPDNFVVAAGVTSSAVAIAALLRVVARLPHGAVVLPGVDLSSPEPEWAAIGGDDTARGIETHPQHHLRLLLDRIGVARAEVVRWRYGDGQLRKAVREQAVSHAFAPARFTAKWVDLPPPQRGFNGVRLATFTTPAHEAQGIAIALREALEHPGRTAALVTPDRALAGRVVAHLYRWGIEADDSAGQSLAAHPVGVLIEAMAQLALEQFAPAALLAVLKHPLVTAGEQRLAWLDGVRRLDLALRGPRPAPGLSGLTAWLDAGDVRERSVRAAAQSWWVGVANRFHKLAGLADTTRGSGLGAAMAILADTLTDLCGDTIWTGQAGRAAAELFDAIALAQAHGPTDVFIADLPSVLRQVLATVTLRPPQGGHARLSIWGTIEARLQSADLTIIGGLNEGSWPGKTASDPWLSPRVRRELGLADPDRRVGLAAHDLAIALGARDVLLTRAVRDARTTTIPSRFLLRIEAMTGGLRAETRLPALAAAIDAHVGPPLPVPRPSPAPPVALRPRRISVTEVDRLKADPYAFYARAMLRLHPLALVDAEPGSAWRGSAVHAVLDAWMRDDALRPDALLTRIDALLASPGVHPVMRLLWQPRLVEALNWIATRIATDRAQGRTPLASELAGTATIAGIELRGIADRVDRLADGRLAIVDYKSGTPPRANAVTAGFSMQLGLLAAIAQRGGFAPVTGHVGRFEYWSLAKENGSFGRVVSPVGGPNQIAEDAFVDRAEAIFTAAAARWLTGSDGFTAQLVPKYAPYDDYNQLMRRDEWYGREA